MAERIASAPGSRFLVLGGTGEARTLAARLVGSGVPVLSSLAGRVVRPRLPEGEVRIGGFGGVEGLRSFIESHGVGAVVDATHPFAATISRHAALACAGTTPLLRLERPGWSCPRGDSWHWADSHTEAAEVTVSLGRRPFLTVGRQSLAAFLDLPDAVVRVVDEPDLDLPSTWTVIRDRGPYAPASERAVFEGQAVDVLVTKDSGGDHTWPKLEVAGALGVPVVVVRRPAAPPGVETVTTVEEVVAWLG